MDQVASDLNRFIHMCRVGFIEHLRLF